MMTKTDIADRNEILRSVVGSGLHGIAIEGTDDHDEMGVFIEPPEYVLGTKSPIDTVVFRTAGEGQRSRPGDLDLIRHSLRKYVSLAIKGNPNFLLLLYAPEDKLVIKQAPLGDELRELAPAIVSKRAVRQTLGYLQGQLKRLTENRKLPKRPELVERYGFDTKYASHAVRLGMQAWELASNGDIELPMREDMRCTVRAVKTGEYTFNAVIDMIARWELYTEAALRNSLLPDEPDYDCVNSWMIHAHQQHWGEGRS